jgi:endonuclease YncB( thermonuclease family)
MSIDVATWDREYLWHFRASLLRVIDGDTIVVNTDNGFYGRHEAHIRLQNVYARELSAYGGKADRDKLIRVLSYLPDGWNLRIITVQKVTIVSETTSFERYVADVFRADTGENIADTLELLS